MSALSLASLFPIFTDIDGNPLEDGYIYVGTAGLNPETNPISAYWDAALSIPAAQPIRTLGGYPSRSGAAARIYVNADDCSLLVKNKNNSLIFSSLNQTERLPAALITFTQAGTGAVARTAKDKMRDVISIKDFGAVGDGTTDDTLSIQAALDTGKDVFIPDGIFKVTDTLTMDTYYQSVFGNGQTSEIRFIFSVSKPGLIMGVPTGATSCAEQQLRSVFLHGHTNVSTTLQLKGPLMRIVGNNIYNATANGIAIDLMDEDVPNGVYCFGQHIVDNHIHATRTAGTFGIRLGLYHQATILDRNFILDAATLIYINGATTSTIITNNIIEGAGGSDAAILITSSGSTPFYNIKIQNNYFEETRFAVSVSAGAFKNIDISGNYASRNLGVIAGSFFFVNTAAAASAASESFTITDNHIENFETFLGLNDEYSSDLTECARNTLTGVTNYSAGTYAAKAYNTRVINSYYVRKLISGAFSSEDNTRLGSTTAVFECAVPWDSREYLDNITFRYIPVTGTSAVVELRKLTKASGTDTLVATVTANAETTYTMEVDAYAGDGFNYYIKVTFSSSGVVGYIYPFSLQFRD